MDLASLMHNLVSSYQDNVAGFRRVLPLGENAILVETTGHQCVLLTAAEIGSTDEFDTLIERFSLLR